MILRILNKNSFTQKFLQPISRINDLCSLIVEDGKIYNLNRTSDNNFSLYAVCTEVETIDFQQKTTLSFSDIKKFIKVFDCIPENSIDLIIHSNYVEYKSNGTRFKFHLINDNIVRSPNYSIDKINSLQFNTGFMLSSSSLNTLIKSSTFITDSNKIYLSTDQGVVIAELNDKSKQNIDTFSTKISDGYSGEEIIKPLGFKFDLFRTVSASKCNEILVNINTNIGFIAIDVNEDKYRLKYTATEYSI